MAIALNLPTDLLRARWWSRHVANKPLADLLDDLEPTEPEAAAVLLRDFLATFDLAQADRGVALAFLETHALAEWVKRWRPRPEVVKDGHIGELRRALHAVAELFEAPPEAVPSGLTLLAPIDLGILAHRLRAQPAEHPALAADMPYWVGNMTVARWLTTLDRREQRIRKDLVDLEQRLVADAALGEAGLEARRAAWQAAPTTPVTAHLLALHERLAASELASGPALSATPLVWKPEEERAHLEPVGALACLLDTCRSAWLEVGPGGVSAVCGRRGDAPCRMKRLLVERALDAVTGDDPAHRAMREHLSAPPWKRLLARLAAAGRGPDLDDVEGHVGWVVRPPDSLVPSRIMPKKGGGLKSRTLQAGEHAQLEQRGHAHAIAMTLVARESRYHFSEHAQMTLQGLAVLAGQAGVYLRRTRDLVPVTVVADSPRVEVIPGDDGAGARLVVRWGDGSDGTDDTVVGRMSPPHAGHWVMRVDEQHLKVYVGRWSAAAVRVWRSLSGDAPAIPEEAAPELAETLLGLAGHVAVKKDASWLGDALAPAPGVVFRLRFEGPRGEKALVVEGRARPVAELGALVPFDGDSVIPVRRDGRIGHVVRDSEAEAAAIHDVARTAGLEVGLSAFDWRVEGLEPAAEVLSALETRSAHDPLLALEWGGVRPRIHRGQGVDKLRLRVGLKRDWLDIAGGYVLDGAELPLRALLAALRDGKRFVALDDERVIEINQALARELAPLTALGRAPRASEAGDGEGGMRASALAAPLVAELQAAGATVDGPPEWLSAASKLDEAAALAVEVPPELVADLRPYQKEGLSWLARLAHWARGACLADDMGLGKTLQALAFLLLRAPVGRALVVAPTSVVSNWLREAERFAPTLGVVPIARGAHIALVDGDAPVIVTSWDLLVRHRERFEAVSWATLVLDEAHAMKNATTRRAQVARAIPAGFVLALTGTPVENRPSELWSLFQAVAPGLLGSAESFRDTFAAPIQNGDSEAPRRLARLVRPFILRRKKVEVAADLPAKSEVRVDVVLGGDERARYEKVRKAVLAELAKDDAHPLDGGRGVIKVLSVLTRLRQLACHPRLVDPHAPATSAKLERLMELVQELRDEGRRTLVFSQFTELLGLVRTAFDEAGVSYAYLDGSTPAERREVEIDTFQSGAVDAFLLSLKAGGVGLNLTAASEVIHLDPWWNPAAEDQATDRAHRIGQDKPVTLYRLVAQGTIEEQILGLHGDKRRMVASLLEGTGSAAALTVDELMALLTEAPDDDALRAPTARSAP